MSEEKATYKTMTEVAIEDSKQFAPPVQYVTQSFAILPLRWESTDYDAAVTADMQRLVMLAYAMVNCGMDVGTIMARMMGVVE